MNPPTGDHTRTPPPVSSQPGAVAHQDGIVQSIYAPVLDSGNWDAIVEQLREACSDAHPGSLLADHARLVDTVDDAEGRAGLSRGSASDECHASHSERVDSLRRHTHRAARMAARLGKLDSEARLRQGVLTGLTQAVLLLDGHGRLLQANPAGLQALAHSGGPLKIKRGCLSGLGNCSSPSLEEGLARADRGMTACLAYQYPRADGGLECGSVRILPLAEVRLLGVPSSRARYLLVIERGGRLNAEALAVFARLFQLTRAEQTVLGQVLEDRTPEEIAAALTVGLPTVRTHLQRIYQKTGTRHQSELVRLALDATRVA